MACLAAELGARCLIPLHPQRWFVAGPDEDRYYVPAPDLSYTLGSSTFVHGPLGTPQGPATPEGDGRTRVAFVGDSVCYGFFASGPANLSQQVERALGPTRFEALNFGVPGYNAHMVSATLRGHALEFHPRAAVYVFHQNDLTNASWSDAYRARPVLFRERYDLPQPLWRRVVERSRFVCWVHDRLARRAPAPRSPTPAASAAPPTYGEYPLALRRLLLEPCPQRDYFRAHLREMRAACAARGVAFALLYVPREETLALDREGTYGAALAQLCREEQVSFLDGQAALAPHASERLFGDSAHPNARAHALLADAVLPWLREVLR